MLAVCTADYGLLSDLYAVCHKCTCDDCAVFYDCTGHQHTVDDLSACADLDIREQDGILYAACYDTALCDIGVFTSASALMYCGSAVTSSV